MKLTLKIAALLIASCGLSSAATVSVACTTDADFTTNPVSFANELNSTWTARVGFYDGTALTTAATFSTINAHWTNVGSVAFATGGGAAGVNGWFSLSGASYDSVATGLGGKQVFVWVSNGTTGNLVMGCDWCSSRKLHFQEQHGYSVHNNFRCQSLGCRSLESCSWNIHRHWCQFCRWWFVCCECGA